MYYSHSLLLRPSTAAYNNRALMYIKLERHSVAIEDCMKVLDEDPNNVKGILFAFLAFLHTSLLTHVTQIFDHLSLKSSSIFLSHLFSPQPYSD